MKLVTLLDVSISHADGRYNGISLRINTEQFSIGCFIIKKPSFAPVNNRLKIIFDISHQFDLIDPSRLTIETDVKCINRELTANIFGKVVNENETQ